MLKNPMLKRIRKIEKALNLQSETDFQPDLSDWTIEELKTMVVWMEAGEVGPLPEILQERKLKYVHPSRQPIFVKLKEVYK